MSIERITTPRGPSLAARLTRAQIRWLYRPFMGAPFPLALQRLLAGSLRWMVARPPHVVTQQIRIGDAMGDRHVPRDLGDAEACIVYFHGGGYTVCSPESHRSLTMCIARASRRTVYVPRYRLAPEHPYPAQLEDATRAVQDLERQGVDVRRMVFAGDSAGGHLALTLALARRDAGASLPESIVLISPSVDWSLTQLPADASDALLHVAWMREVRDGYVTPDRYAQPLVSPIHASLKGLPPVLIQSSSVEQLATDAARLHAALESAGGVVAWQEWAGLWHDFQLHAIALPEGREAVARIAAFIDRPA
ncbi:MAG: alpha/beta hydrolase [Proteobacteria bacterium]|nr:alpha/beta hydrolase [Pseudomonadota bacterium]